jgi:hypothetical protein
MLRANLDRLHRLNNKQKAWLAAGIVVVGLAGMNNPPRGAQFSPAGGNAPAARGGTGFVAPGGGATPPMDWNAPATGGYAPQAGNYIPQTGGYTPAPTGASPSDAELPSNGDSVSDRVNTNFDDYIRGQQRVVSENDGQTYIVDGNADPNQMTDTRDGVSGFTAATPGSEAAGYADVAPSGATTPDTSTATPVDTGSASSATTTE